MVGEDLLKQSSDFLKYLHTQKVDKTTNLQVAEEIEFPHQPYMLTQDDAQPNGKPRNIILDSPDKTIVGNQTACLIRIDDDCDIIRPITTNSQI